MIHERHPAVAVALVEHLENPGTPCLQAVASAARDLTGVGGFEPPSWRELMTGARPEPREPEEFEPGTTRDGWQHEASSHVEESFRAESLFPRMCDSRKALLRSQGGPGAGLALSTCPVNRLTTFTSELSRVVLLRRLHLPLPLAVATAGVAFHLTLVAITVQLVRVPGFWEGGWAVENAAARICREVGGRVTTNVLIRDLDLAAPHVVMGCPSLGELSLQLTLVSALRADGSCRRRAAQHDGLAAEAARLRKARTYPELVGPHRRAHLVVLALEVGRWSRETQAFVTQLARAKARGETQLMRQRVEQGWRLRWGSILACAAARAVASTVLELPGARGSDGNVPPSHDVEWECRFAGLAR